MTYDDDIVRLHILLIGWWSGVSVDWQYQREEYVKRRGVL